MKSPRKQKLFAIRRDGKWWTGAGGWSEEIGLAHVEPRADAERAIRIDISLPDCRLYEIRPELNR